MAVALVTDLCLTGTTCPPQTFTPKTPTAPTGLGDAIIMAVLPLHEVSRPITIAFPWVQIIDAGGITTADNGGSDIEDPDDQIDGLSKHILKVNRKGSFLQVRMKYDDSATGLTDPVVQIFGRYNGDEMWQRLRNLSSSPSINVTIVTDQDANDVTDGTFKYTDPLFDAQTVDLNATDEILVGVKTNFSSTGGITNNAVLQAKLIGGIRTY